MVDRRGPRPPRVRGRRSPASGRQRESHEQRKSVDALQEAEVEKSRSAASTPRGLGAAGRATPRNLVTAPELSRNERPRAPAWSVIPGLTSRRRPPPPSTVPRPPP